MTKLSSPVRGRVARSIPMTIDEATSLLEQSVAGRLDESLPGTKSLLDQARRTQTDHYVWGTTKSDPRRRTIRRAIVFGCLMVIATMVGLALPFITSHT